MSGSSNSVSRRRLIKLTGDAILLSGVAEFLAPSLLANAAGRANLPFANGERPVVAYPQKRPLIRLTTRPPQLETPFSVFNESAITPNDAFFVRYHLTQSPPSIDPDSFRLEVKGKVNNPLTLSLRELKAFDAAEIVAVNQCSGNSRGLSNPRVAGGQLGNGAMGNARWKGVPLKAILDKAGVPEGAKQVTFKGLDAPAMEGTPGFVKALDIDHLRTGEVLVAYGMNGEDLPILNGYPVRLVVPGYYGTYWVKHLNEITVVDNVYDGFWMKTAYRIPNNPCACVAPGTKPASTVPINRLNVRSFITSHSDGAKIAAGRPITIRGIAFDGGYGIAEVALSTDGGKTWRSTTLGKDLGKYSFRVWTTSLTLDHGTHSLAVRAVNHIGQTQPMDALWNPAGYMRNVVEKIKVSAVQATGQEGSRRGA
jgi:sulfite dehydrogenase (cytochrome) subunit A